MYFDWELYLEKHNGRILASGMRLLINKQIYSGRYALFGMIYKFLPDESD
jgi:hypothetical protein